MSSTLGLDFSALSLQDALDLAVLVEEEARERYEEFADQMEMHDTPEAAGFFRWMSGNEEKHRVALAARRSALFGDSPGRLSRRMIFDVEAPDYDEARAFMTARTALHAAMRAEQKAHAFFVAALPGLTNPEVRALFEELRDEEMEHQELVLRQLEKTPPDPDLTAEDFADEPVGQ